MQEAARRLSLRCRLLAVSPVYETAPVGNTERPSFLHAAALIETGPAAAELKTQVLRVIERKLGRVCTWIRMRHALSMSASGVAALASRVYLNRLGSR